MGFEEIEVPDSTPCSPHFLQPDMSGRNIKGRPFILRLEITPVSQMG